MDYIAIISKARPQLKENTLKNYKTQLNKMVKIFGEDWWNEKTADEVVETILASDLSQTYKRNVLQASTVLLTSVMKLSDADWKELGITWIGKKDYTEMSDKFREEMFKLNKDYEKQNEDNPYDVISQNQKENMITYDELRDYIDRVKKDIGKEEMLYIAYVVLESLFWVPVRNDHAGMIYIGKRDFNHLSAEERKDKNYLVDTVSKKLTFVYYQDVPKVDSNGKEIKTTKTRPAEFQDLPKDLEKIWKKYIRDMKYKKGDVIIPLTRNQLTKLLIQVSERYIGKRVSTTLIRHIVAYHRNGGKAGKEKKQEQIELAKAMGHSVEVQDKIYNKA